nr:hypothetical protein BDOA9_0205760 [Bradyrhizobium sp. DOA9]
MVEKRMTFCGFSMAHRMVEPSMQSSSIAKGCAFGAAVAAWRNVADDERRPLTTILARCGFDRTQWWNACTRMPFGGRTHSQLSQARNPRQEASNALRRPEARHLIAGTPMGVAFI